MNLFKTHETMDLKLPLAFLDSWKKGIKYEVIDTSQLTIEELAVKGVIDETGLDIKDGRVKFFGE